MKVLIKKHYWDLFWLFLIWRFVITLVGYFGVGRFQIVKVFYDGSKFDKFFMAWANWDGGHYVGIAVNGYSQYFQHAFFPIYPLLIKITAFVAQNSFLAAYLVTGLSVLGTIIFLYKLVLLDYSEEIAWKTVVYFLIFPSSIFLAVAYSEATFLFFAVTAFYFAKIHKWYLSAIMASLATGTKFVGIFVVIALIVEWCNQSQFNFSKILSWQSVKKYPLWLMTASSGLLLYMLYLLIKWGDPLFFLHVESYWQRSTAIVNPLTVLINYTNFLVFSTDYYLSLIFIAASFLIYKKISKSMGVYTFLITVFPLLTGTIVSQTRYVLAGFPFFILLAGLSRYKLLDFFITSSSLILLGLFIVLFINGHWLA